MKAASPSISQPAPPQLARSRSRRMRCVRASKRSLSAGSRPNTRISLPAAAEAMWL